MEFVRIFSKKYQTCRKLGFRKSVFRICFRLKCIMRGIIIRSISFVCKFVNHAVYPIIYSRIHKDLLEIPPETQVFLIARQDFGSLICNMHYAALWKKERGDIAIVILTRHVDFMQSLVRAICPDVRVISYEKSLPRGCKIFIWNPFLYNVTILMVYSQVLMEKINAIFLWDIQPHWLGGSFVGEYIEAFDHNLCYARKRGDAFYEAYRYFRKHFFICYENWCDYNALLVHQQPLTPSEEMHQSFDKLRKELSIERPYVILHLSGSLSGFPVADRRRIHNPSRFDRLIDQLIGKGYAVVIQGRDEQPRFEIREHLINYAFSEICTPANDLALYSQAKFVIASKTGPEIFCQLFDIPLLGVNYNEPAMMLHPIKYRYFYKHIREIGGKFLNWKEVLSHPIFFEFGVSSTTPELEAYVFEEMSEEEILESLDEFLMLLDQPTEKWLEYSEIQKAFKAELDPSHFDLFTCQSVPCDSYLRSIRSGISI